MMETSLSIWNSLAPYVVPLFVVKLALVLFGKDLKDFAFEWIKEGVAMLSTKPRLAALNGYSLLLLAVILLVLASFGFSVMPQPQEAMSAVEFAKLEVGARAFYTLCFLLAAVCCVYLTKHERN